MPRKAPRDSNIPLNHIRDPAIINSFIKGWSLWVVEGLVFRASGLGYRVWGSEYRVEGLGFRVLEVQKLRTYTFGLRVLGLGGISSLLTVPSWVPIIIRHLFFRVPKKGP